ncbi:MAG: organic solvent tolerance protein OstA [Patescibacteria group bacterium]|nr:organic solvent tolerance protein OstA [Patescibacteria group bacterium]
MMGPMMGPGMEPRAHSQLGEPAAAGVQAAQPRVVVEPLPGGTRRIRMFPRGDVPVQAQWFPEPVTQQWIAVVDSGVNLIVDGLDQFGSIDVTADRLVLWTRGSDEPDLTGQTLQDEAMPLEVYMEGNIVFRQGQRIIHAEQMYYDVANSVGTVLRGEMLTPAPKYQGLVRLKADVVQQLGRDRYFARNGFVTSSRMGQPGYRLQAGDVEFQDIQTPAVEPFTGRPVIDPATGEQAVAHEQLVTAHNNLLFLGPLPVFYWPVFATDVQDPTFYIRHGGMRNDQVNGLQFFTTWNAYQLLGMRNRPEGTTWDITLDYLGKRGLGHGTNFVYQRPSLLGLAGPVGGIADYWGIHDDGKDSLGVGRRNLAPETDYRYRLLWQHRHQLPADLQLTLEAGLISDRNFLEEYFENEWDQLKDQTTGAELKQLLGNQSWSITADVRVNPFFTQTDWLPRADHFWLGQSLLGDAFTWYAHSSAGYAQLKTGDAPKNATQAARWTPEAWEVDGSGERLATRQEIDWPFQLGPVRVVPYALGELAHWGQDINGDDLQRAYWQMGVRANLPVWSVNPNVESELFNVHGMAHKINFKAEFLAAESNRDLELLPLYDPLDDDSIEAFRNRMPYYTYGTAAIPERFDERFYALRTGLASWVTSPSTEVADDLMMVRLGAEQRWQTKRGRPGARRIVDWVVLDSHISLFPKEERDNFGNVAGLFDYNFRWHVGDRLTLTSDGLFDFFHDGQQLISFGAFLARPPRGSLYVGMQLLDGPIQHSVLSMSYSYRMSPKWASTFGTSFDLRKQENLGQSFSITRIGESLLINVGFRVNAARDTVGIGFSIEPRFLPNSKLTRLGGMQIPPAGLYGLE